MKILVDDPESLISHLAQSNVLSDSCMPGSQEKAPSPGEVCLTSTHQEKFGVGIWHLTGSSHEGDWQILGEKSCVLPLLQPSCAKWGTWI